MRGALDAIAKLMSDGQLEAVSFPEQNYAISTSSYLHSTIGGLRTQHY